MKHRWPLILAVASVMILAVVLAGCAPQAGALAAGVPEAEPVRYIPTAQGAATSSGSCGGICTPAPQQSPESYTPSAADAASVSGSCGGLCYGYVESGAASPAASPYAGGGCVVGRADNTPSACNGDCDYAGGGCVVGRADNTPSACNGDCDYASADGSCTGSCAGAVSSNPIPGGGCIAGKPVAGSPCGIAGQGSATGCELVR